MNVLRFILKVEILVNKSQVKNENVFDVCPLCRRVKKQDKKFSEKFLSVKNP